MTIVTARPTVIQRAQFGRETTYGTAVPATMRFPTWTFKASPKAESMEYTTQGRSTAGVVVPNREWSSASAEGPMTYGELVYLYCSLFGAVSPSAGMHGDQTWLMAPSLDAQDVPAVFTMQHGDDSSNSIKVPGCVFTGGTMEMSRKEAKITAELLGQSWVTGQSLTARTSAPLLENVPILPGTIACYLDSTWSGRGQTLLTRMLSTKVAFTGRWQPEWVLDPSGNFVQLVQAKPTATVTFKMEANSTAMALFTQYRAGTIAYLEIQATGPLIYTAIPYLLLVDIPIEFKEPTEFEDEEGVYAIGWEAAMISDDTAGFPIEVSIVNQVAAL
jgi:hypothetical protein